MLATDFSASVRPAEHFAALLAQHYGTTLIVAHAFALAQPAIEAEELTHLPSMQRRDLDHRLSVTVEELARIAPKVETVLSGRSPAETIDRLLQQHQPAMAVLGTHGGGALERRFVGSVAEEILRSVSEPVLTVGPHVATPSPTRLSFRNILYATDFSPAAARAGFYALALARSFRSKLDVLHVVSNYTAEKRDQIERQEREFLAALGEHASGIGNIILTPRTFVEIGKARDRILTHAREGNADLIVLGAHYHSQFARHLRTGPAFQIILEATCPVLTVCVSEDRAEKRTTNPGS